jgi:hypothetical protein
MFCLGVYSGSARRRTVVSWVWLELSVESKGHSQFCRRAIVADAFGQFAQNFSLQGEGGTASRSTMQANLVGRVAGATA